MFHVKVKKKTTLFLKIEIEHQITSNKLTCILGKKMELIFS